MEIKKGCYPGLIANFFKTAAGTDAGLSHLVGKALSVEENEVRVGGGWRIVPAPAL